MKQKIIKATSNGDFSMFNAPSELIKWLIDLNICDDKKTARKWMHDKIPKEKYYQKKIIEFLKTLKALNRVDEVFCWNVQGGPYQVRGLPDVFAIVKTNDKTKIFGFEVKRPLLGSPSELQIVTMQKMRQAGGIAEIVSYPFEVEKILSRYKMLKKEV